MSLKNIEEEGSARLSDCEGTGNEVGVSQGNLLLWKVILWTTSLLFSRF